ncbi:hypothetical protein BRADI_1g00361v3 [Brachypodium distachyon]|uniref:Uncharacterized protein n=1 Tax=Brachypodium distachyon TaxID=15368 RepID=A0A2K2DHF9_BRADI|nr:hypothetical protein BRADI_1g00361v3 [Brachypodium distachyon]
MTHRKKGNKERKGLASDAIHVPIRSIYRWTLDSLLVAPRLASINSCAVDTSFARPRNPSIQIISDAFLHLPPATPRYPSAEPLRLWPSAAASTPSVASVPPEPSRSPPRLPPQPRRALRRPSLTPVVPPLPTD